MTDAGRYSLGRKTGSIQRRHGRFLRWNSNSPPCFIVLSHFVQTPQNEDGVYITTENECAKRPHVLSI